MRAKIGLLSLAVLALGAGHVRAEPVQIRVAWVAPVANWITLWLDKKDLAKHFGQSYVFEPVHFAGTPPMVTAIANNEVEIGDLAYSTLPIAIKNAGMDDIRVIADDFQDGVGDYYSVRFYRAQGRSDQEGRGPQGQGRRHQCRGQRRRHRHEGDAAQARS